MNLRQLLSNLFGSWNSAEQTPAAGRPRHLGGVELLEARVVLSAAGTAVEYFERDDDQKVFESIGHVILLSERQAFAPSQWAGPVFERPFAPNREEAFAAKELTHEFDRHLAEPDQPNNQGQTLDLPVYTFASTSIPLSSWNTADSDVDYAPLQSDLVVGIVRSIAVFGAPSEVDRGASDDSHSVISIVITTTRAPIFAPPVNATPPSSYIVAASPRPQEIGAVQAQRPLGNSSYVQSLIAADDSFASDSSSGDGLTNHSDSSEHLIIMGGIAASRVGHRTTNTLTVADDKSDSQPDGSPLAKGDGADDAEDLIELTRGSEGLAGKKKAARTKSLREQAALVDGSLRALATLQWTNEGATLDRAPLRWPSDDASAAGAALPPAWSPEQAGLIELLATDLAQLAEPATGAAKQSYAAFRVMGSAPLKTASDSYQAFELATGADIGAPKDLQANTPREDQIVAAATPAE